MLASIGAYIASDRQLLTPFGQIGTVIGVYDIPAAHVSIDAVLSNTRPTAPYRGAGRPEAIYLIERAMEDAARELNIDPIELRRRNIIPDEKIPFKSSARPLLRLRPVPPQHGHSPCRPATTPASPPAAKIRQSAACCAASAWPTRSSRPPAPRRNSPKSASIPAAARCC